MRWVIDATHHKFKMGLGISCGLMPRLQATAAPVRHTVARCRTGWLRDVASPLHREIGEKC